MNRHYFVRVLLCVNHGDKFNQTELWTEIRPDLWSLTLKNPRAALLLSVILAAPAFVLADNIPGHSRSGNNYVTFSEGFTEQQDLQGSSARCNFLLGSIKENGSNTNSIPHASFSEFAGSEFARGDKGFNFSALPNAGVKSDSREVNLVDFRGNGNKNSSFGRDKGKGRGKHSGGDGEGNSPGTGSGIPLPLVSVAEPGSQTLLLFGFASLGLLFYRRKSLTNAISARA